MFKRFLILLTLLSLTSCGQNQAKVNHSGQNITTASPNATASTQHSDIKNALQANLNHAAINATVLDITPIDMPGMYLAQLQDLPPIFTDSTGTYLLQGSLIKLDGKNTVNLSEAANSIVAKQALASVDKKDMIIFPATKNPKAAVYVFSDPSCHYCQLLHKDMDKINALGIEVRYLAWPRAEEMKPLTEAIWCSDNRQQALTNAKLGQGVVPVSCDNPVQKQIELGHALGVAGTPAIFTEDGRNIGGYLEPEELQQAIQEKP